VATRAGFHRETLRYYERRGLIPPPPRRVSGYRAYPTETVDRVRLIKWAQGLGFTLREIGELSRIPRDHVRGRAAQVRTRAAAKIREIGHKIDRLQAMRRQLEAIVRCRCDGDCPIVGAAISPPGGQRHE
jgi:MerR family transcriptional regulator, copper efflux regulator